VLATVEHRNLDRYGYGIKAFTLSMLEAAIEATDGAIGTDELGQILAAGRSMLDHPVDLIDGVDETVAALAEAGYRLVVVTKGDLHHQEAKLWRSGLVDHFERVEIVAEKDPDTYRRVVASMDVAPEGFAWWATRCGPTCCPCWPSAATPCTCPTTSPGRHEHADHDGTVPTLETIRLLPAWLAGS
jgi:putative hydrolase of the HAD superfamily